MHKYEESDSFPVVSLRFRSPTNRSPQSQEYGNYKIDPCLNYNYLPRE